MAILVSLLIAFFISMRVEFETQRTVDKAIPIQDMGWLRTDIDGARVRIFGDAPTDEARFRASEAVSKAVNVGRVVNDITAPEMQLDQPELSIEIVQNPRMSSIIGLLPKEPSPVPIYYALDRANPDVTTLNLVDSLETPVDESWEAKVEYLVFIIGKLSNVKISATEDKVRVETVVPDDETAEAMRQELLAQAPEDFEVELEITAPRPLIAPFVYAERKEGETFTVERCSATDEDDLKQIVDAHQGMSASDFEACKLGLGAPTEDWGLLIAELHTEADVLGNYALQVSDNQVHLDYSEVEDPDAVEQVSSGIRASLPPGFGFDSQRIVVVRSIDELEADGSSVAFFVKKEIGGKVTVEGVVGSEAMKTNVDSISVAKFGSAEMETDISIVEGLPAPWEKYVFATVNGVGELNQGEATLTPDFLAIKGTTDTEEHRQSIVQNLQNEIGDLTLQQEISVSEDIAVAASIDPNDCVDRINTTLTENPIEFEPSSARISDESQRTIVQISQVLYECRAHSFEIGGHTDSRGGEDVNQRISEERAQAVLEAVMLQALDFGPLAAKGYGESDPVATNDTEEGRAKNRRIEIRLNVGTGE